MNCAPRPLAVRTAQCAGKPTVRVVYSDETGTGSEANEPFAVVVAAMFNLDSQWNPIGRAIGRLLQRHRFHGRELKGRRLYKSLRRTGDQAVANLLIGLHCLASDFRLQLFVGAVSRADFKTLEPSLGESGITANAAAFGECLNAVDRYMWATWPRQQVLWIADRSGEDDKLKAALAWQRTLQLVDLREAFPALNLPPPAGSSKIADTIYFGHSHESRALQLADVYCSTVALYLQDEFLGQRNAASRALFGILRPNIINYVAPLFLGLANDWRGKTEL
jgi:Protein of unknown function (DUF3800)